MYSEVMGTNNIS